LSVDIDLTYLPVKDRYESLSEINDVVDRTAGAIEDGIFDAIDRPQVAYLPAVRWKLINLDKLKNENAAKHAEQRHELKGLLG
jgi:hypothetical protein